MSTPHYHINLFWSADDACWVADVPDLAPCSAHGDTPGEAVANINDAIDGWLGVVGTANLDYRSLRLNFEVSALLYGRRTIERLAELFEADRALAARMKPRRLRFVRRLAQSAARVLSPQL